MTMRNSHCSFCGTPFGDRQAWPRTCATCGNTSYLNPVPVAVLLQPVDDGLLTIRRSVEPRAGELALPGGFIDHGESWQAAAVRELREEAGIVVDATTVELFDVHSAPDGTVLIFALAPPQASAALPAFTTTNETTERLVVNQPLDLAFPLHTHAVRTYFARR